MSYFSFQGKIYLAKKNADGTPKDLVFVGNCPEGSIGFETETIDHVESTSGQRTIDYQLETQKTGNLNLTLEDIQQKNLLFAFRGTAISNNSGSVTNEAFTPSSALAAGQVYRLKKQNISAVTIKDSAGSPATLTANTHYRIKDAAFGLIEILDPATYTAPLKADYTAAAQAGETFLSAAREDLYLFCQLYNTANELSKDLFELYRCQLKPVQEFALINNELGQIQLEGVALRDENFEADPNFGQFGRHIKVS